MAETETNNLGCINITLIVSQVILALLIAIGNFSSPGRPYYVSVQEYGNWENGKKSTLGIWTHGQLFNTFSAKFIVAQIFLLFSVIMVLSNIVMLFIVMMTYNPRNESEPHNNIDSHLKDLGHLKDPSFRTFMHGCQYLCILVTTWSFSHVAEIEQSYFPLNALITAVIISMFQCFLLIIPGEEKTIELDKDEKIDGRDRIIIYVVLAVEVLVLLISFGCFAKIEVESEGGKIMALEVLTLYPPNGSYENTIYAMFWLTEIGALLSIITASVALEVRTHLAVSRTWVLNFILVCMTYIFSLALVWTLSRSGFVQEANINDVKPYTAFIIAMIMFVLQHAAIILQIVFLNISGYPLKLPNNYAISSDPTNQSRVSGPIGEENAVHGYEMLDMPVNRGSKK